MRHIAVGWSLIRLGLVAGVAVSAMLLAGCGDVVGTAHAQDHGATGKPVIPLKAEAKPTKPGMAARWVIDYVDFFVMEGRQYTRAAAPRPVTEPVTRAGREVGRTRSRLEGMGLSPYYHPRDGDAAFLPVGTAIYEVDGYSTRFRLGIKTADGQLAVYEVDTDPRARVGSDLLDIGGKVRTVMVLNGYAGDHVLRTITSPATIRVLVAAILNAKIIPWISLNEDPWFVRFDLADGTAVQRAWFPKAEQLQRSILLPAQANRILEGLPPTG